MAEKETPTDWRHEPVQPILLAIGNRWFIRRYQKPKQKETLKDYLASAITHEPFQTRKKGEIKEKINFIRCHILHFYYIWFFACG